jgi:hypothetical protein
MEKIAHELIRLVEDASQKLKVIDDQTAARRPSAGEWSKKEIIGHLIDSAANNHQRFVRAQQEKALSLPGYDQERWVALQGHQENDWHLLIELWRAYNLHLAHLIRRIDPQALATPCTIGSGVPVTLEFIVQDYLRHLRGHFAQLDFKSGLS